MNSPRIVSRGGTAGFAEVLNCLDRVGDCYEASSTPIIPSVDATVRFHTSVLPYCAGQAIRLAVTRAVRGIKCGASKCGCAHPLSSSLCF